MGLTDLQRRKYEALFRAYDVDENQVLERSDHTDIVENACKLRGYHPHTREYHDFHAKMIGIWEDLEALADADGDFTVGPDEWLEFYESFHNTPREKYDQVIGARNGLMIDMVDLDGDNALNLAEYRQFLECYHIDGQHGATSFPKLDLNGDGRISKPELLQLMEQWVFSDDPASPGNYLFGPY